MSATAPRIIGVNGIRSTGEKNTDRLLGELEKLGHRIFDFNYGIVRAWEARSEKRQRAIGHRLHETSRDGDHVIAHSYGGLVTLRAMQAGARFGVVWLFAPAMDGDYTFPIHGAREIHIVSSRTDIPLLLGSLLPGHSFGGMGRVGYKGPPDDRVHNHIAGPLLCAHSAYFKPAHLKHWAGLISRSLENQTKPGDTQP